MTGGFSIGPRPRLPQRQCQQQSGWGQQPMWGGQQPFYSGGQQPFYGNGHMSAPYPQGDMGGGYGPGVGRGVAGWFSGGGRVADPVPYNTGDTPYRR